mgnify:CR=1 FL=1
MTSGLSPPVLPTQTAVDSDGVYPTIQASRLAPESPSWLVPVLAADARPPAETWQLVTGETRTGASAKSVQLWLNCSGEKGFRVLFDDIEFAAK